jgi:phosphatidate cytidylyltransferase
VSGFSGDLGRRVLTAALALPPLVALVWLAPAGATVAVVGLATAVAGWELRALIRARGLPTSALTSLLLAASLFLEMAGLSPGPPLWPLALLALLAQGTLARTGAAEALAGVATCTTGAVYLGSLGGMLAGLRTLPPGEQGPGRLLMLLLVLMAADAAAYFTGTALGRRRLLPSVSPGKTVEGTLGGLAGGAAAAVVAARLGLVAVPALHAVLLGVGLALLGVLGDLFESLLKRWAGVKDSGRVFPGHGGMLDRLDSLLFGAPLLYHYFRLVS